MGLGLAVPPVPLLVAAFRWLDRVEPGPWRNLLIASPGELARRRVIAIVANSFATRWIGTATADPAGADTLGAAVIAPVVEESAKAAAVLLVFLFRRRDFTGIVDGVVIAGVTATGFAFTENILYLGNAFGTDQLTGDSGIASVTAATFFVRVVIAVRPPALHRAHRHRLRHRRALHGPAPPAPRPAPPWPACCWRWACTRCGTARRRSASTASSPCTGLHGAVLRPADLAGDLDPAARTGHRTRRTPRVRHGRVAHSTDGAVPRSARCGARRIARRHAHRHAGEGGGAGGWRSTGRTRPRWRSCAGAGGAGGAGADFAVRSGELLGALWHRRDVARPALDYAARAYGAARAGGRAALDAPATGRTGASTRRRPRRRLRRRTRTGRVQPYTPYHPVLSVLPAQRLPAVAVVPALPATTGCANRPGTRPTLPSASPPRPPSGSVPPPQQRRRLLSTVRADAIGAATVGPRGQPGEGDRGHWGRRGPRRSRPGPRGPVGRARSPGAFAAPPARGLSTAAPGRYLPVRKPAARA